MVGSLLVGGRWVRRSVVRGFNKTRNNNPLNDEEHDHEDYIINSEYCSLIHKLRMNIF